MPANSPILREPLLIFLSGDVMTGRGIDQILAHPGDPGLRECYVHDARDYIALAEQVNGPIPRLVDDAYPWGDALAELDRAAPHARIVNLETSVTARGTPWPKGINYRMNPANVECLVRAQVDCCVLANNHVIDWGYDGLTDTLLTLRRVGIATAGAGEDAAEAAAPAILPLPGGSRLLVFGGGLRSSGIPARWGAAKELPGVNLLPGISDATIRRISTQVMQTKQKADVAIFSVHWGGNWGYEIPDEHRQFAHRLIDEAGIDMVHGHSSHHVKGVEVYRGKPILYGAGDLLNDYEGISGYEVFRGDLALLYLLSIDPITHGLTRWQLVPMQVRQFQLHHASAEDARWLAETLDREGRTLGTWVEMGTDGRLSVNW